MNSLLSKWKYALFLTAFVLTRAEAGSQVMCPKNGDAEEIVLNPWEDKQRLMRAVSLDNTGEYVAVVDESWRDYNQTTTVHLLDSCGRHLCDPFSFPEDNWSACARAAKAPDGSFLVTWIYGEVHVWVWAFDGEGNPLGEPKDASSGQQWEAVYNDAFIACDRECNYVVVWEWYCFSSEDERCDEGFRVRRFDREGNWLGKEFYGARQHLRDRYPPQIDFFPIAVAAGPNGESVVSTTGYNPENFSYRTLSVWLFDRDLNLKRGPILVTDMAYHPYYTKTPLAMDGQGNFAVGWLSVTGDWWKPDDEYGPPYEQILVQIFSRDGERIGEPIPVTGEPLEGTHFRNPSVGMDSEGNFVVVYNRTDRGALFCQRFDSEGERIGHTFQVNASPYIRPDAPTGPVSMNDEGQFVVGYALGPQPHPMSTRVRLFDFYAKEFLRGDANTDGDLSVADVLSILNFLFAGGEEPDPPDAADVNDSGVIDLSDAIYLVGYLFAQNPRHLPHPYPYYGFDPTPDDL